MTKTVVIVDDEPANIDLLKGLMPESVKVKAALKGEVAIKLISKQTPDIVFLDLVMPGLNGFETLAQIRTLENCEDLPVAIVSGNASDSDIQKSQDLGAIGFLQKPVQAEQLNKIIDTYL